MSGIIRVFPKQTSYTPTDEYAFYGLPPLEMWQRPAATKAHMEQGTDYKDLRRETTSDGITNRHRIIWD